MRVHDNTYTSMHTIKRTYKHVVRTRFYPFPLVFLSLLIFSLSRLSLSVLSFILFLFFFTIFFLLLNPFYFLLYPKFQSNSQPRLNLQYWKKKKTYIYTLFLDPVWLMVVVMVLFERRLNSSTVLLRSSVDLGFVPVWVGSCCWVAASCTVGLMSVCVVSRSVPFVAEIAEVSCGLEACTTSVCVACTSLVIGWIDWDFV